MQMRQRAERIVTVYFLGSDIDERLASWSGTSRSLDDGWPIVPCAYKKHFNDIDRFKRMLSCLTSPFALHEWRVRVLNSMIAMPLYNAWVLWLSHMTEDRRQPLTEEEQEMSQLRVFVEEVAHGLAADLKPTPLGQHRHR